VIQSMVETSPGKKSAKSMNNVDEPSISRLQSKTTPVARFILQFVWPKARKGVGARELSKSISVKLLDAFKQAYWKLAEMMVKESRLPDQDLLFFFTHNEIGKLLETRSARLITRAVKRRQVFGKQASMRFSRINRGHPIPINISSSDVKSVAAFKVSGLPVSLGFIKGKARIVTSLAEASTIQNGDILIVEYTDVGWSPYFPMITGLVTEIGGLLSHGAVVAREYGLPCVVNVPNATRLFKSGDTVILNGTLGTVEKIEEE
jgi:rifampicin phosphotransferase